MITPAERALSPSGSAAIKRPTRAGAYANPALDEDGALHSVIRPSLGHTRPSTGLNPAGCRGNQTPFYDCSIYSPFRAEAPIMALLERFRDANIHRIDLPKAATLTYTQ